MRLVLEGGADPTHKNKVRVHTGCQHVHVRNCNVCTFTTAYNFIYKKELEKHTASQPVVIPFSDLEFKRRWVRARLEWFARATGRPLTGEGSWWPSNKWMQWMRKK